MTKRQIPLSRREFTKLAVTAPLLSRANPLKASASMQQNQYAGGLTDIPGIRVGHYTESLRPTGCTVVLTEAGAVAGVDVRGSAPGTSETDLLDPVKTVAKVHAVVLSGGSAFGLETAHGVMQYLEERGTGFAMGDQRVPIVPAAILYDLSLGDGKIRPGKKQGYLACKTATAGMVQEGSLGAGTGATVGKLFGLQRAMKGGIGSVSFKVGDLVVAALVAVNAVGDVRDPRSGELLAGARSQGGRELADAAEYLRTNPFGAAPASGQNSTLGVVATNARLDKVGATKVAQMSHDGYARAINPIHTSMDGDTVFALSLGEVEANLDQVGFLAAEATAQAIVRAIKTAERVSRIPTYTILKRIREGVRDR